MIESPPTQTTTLELRGLEHHNLLAFLALLGAMRSLDVARPEWRTRASWNGPPWTPQLHVAAVVTQADVAAAATDGIARLAAAFDVDGRKNVDFEQTAYRAYAERMSMDETSSRLAAALCAEQPLKDDGKVRAAPLVLMFGQGHQHFLTRLDTVSRANVATKSRDASWLAAPERIEEALFHPWRRDDDTPAFRWDPTEDQRYALRFGDPSKAGAATTVHGANRLAAVGLLSFPCVPRARRQSATAWAQESFYWPLWRPPLRLAAVEVLLRNPALTRGDLSALGPLGVVEILSAKRVSNAKFFNVTPGTPVRTTRRLNEIRATLRGSS
jgi:hypothetical protein